jgi:anti-sigma-K factor RskA
VEPLEPQEHERIDELMAGYALRSLTGDDAREADRLLSDHVPGCARCRATLLAFSDVVADLALAADPIEPPETLLPRLHNEMEPRSGPRTARWVGMAAGTAVVLIAGGLAVSQGMRARDLEQQTSLLEQALAYSQRPNANTAPLESQASDPAPVSEVSAPDADHFFLIGDDVPLPPSGSIYGVWLSNGVDVVYAGAFLPHPGTTVVRVPFDRSRFDRVLVTIEPEGVVPSRPGEPVWEAAA